MIDYKYPEVGAFAEGSATFFVVWAPTRKQVELVIEGQPHLMDRDERGYWRMKIKDAKPGMLYQYRLDNEKTLPDPASISQPQGVQGPSAVADRSFAWTDSSWTGLALSEMIVYELHAGTFTAAGNFEGVISKLSYLKDLGVNAIELMPVSQFPGTRNWGYDGVFPFAVQHSYGGMHGLKQLVDEAHRQGIAVILDVVYNHLGPEGNYFGKYGPYFTDKYKTFWGKAINFDDAWCDGVRNFYWQNALMWLNDFHIDGLRLDAVHAIWDFSARHFIEELRTKVNVLDTQTGRKKILIAEFDLNNPRYINPLSKGGYGLDGQWIDEFHHALHAVVTGERDGYYEDFGEVSHIAKALRDSYVYTGQYSEHRKKHFGTLPVDNPCHQFVVFSQNHDQIGNRLLGDRLTTKLSFEGLKLMAAAYLLSPHVPLLFMGEEYGEKNPFQYFISHTDKELVHAVREGRKKEFAYFGWKEEVPDPQDEKTFRQCVLSWKPDDVLLNYYKWLIAFRKTRKAMQNKERNSVIVLPVSNKILCFERIFGQDQLLVVLNFGKEKGSVKQPFTNSIRKIFDSSSKTWNGPGEVSPETLSAAESFFIHPESVLIFEVINV
jgi:maltooligosyltrehalose trehalohydrolase